MKLPSSETVNGMAFLGFCAFVAWGLYVNMFVPPEPVAPAPVAAIRSNQPPLDNYEAVADAIEREADEQVSAAEESGMEAAWDPDAWLKHPSFAAFKFEDYSAEPFTGPLVKPDFQGRQSQYANYRTRIREGLSAGPQFAGSLAIPSATCGSSCVYYFITDLRTGTVYKPAGYDSDGQLMDHQLDYRRDSALMFENFRTAERQCVYRVSVWTGSDLKMLSSMSQPLAEEVYQCP